MSVLLNSVIFSIFFAIVFSSGIGNLTKESDISSHWAAPYGSMVVMHPDSFLDSGAI